MGYRGQNRASSEAIGGLPNITADGHDVLEQLFWENPWSILLLKY
jgi:hypothetical protein